MTTETIIRIKITASEGMVLTDGKVYGKIVYLAEGDDPSTFKEISKEEFAAIEAERNAKEALNET